MIMLIPTISKENAEKILNTCKTLRKSCLTFYTEFLVAACYLFAEPLTSTFFPQKALPVICSRSGHAFFFFVMPLQAYLIGLDQ
jgi:O-antigen/teichoic acid export membrane protein